MNKLSSTLGQRKAKGCTWYYPELFDTYERKVVEELELGYDLVC